MKMFPSNRLTARDLAMFESLRIPIEVLAEFQVSRVTDPEARECLSINGRAGDMQGLKFPRFHYLTGQICGYSVRRDNPEIENGKPRRKYLHSYADRNHLYSIPGSHAQLTDASLPVVLVEAQKSVMALIAWARRMDRKMLVYGLGGVWNWRGTIGKAENSTGHRVDEKGAIPDLEVCRGRKVYILYDSNVATNPDAKRARNGLKKALREMDAKPFILELPQGSWNGPDDFIGAAGDEAMADLFSGKKPTADVAPSVWTDDDLTLKFTASNSDLRYVAPWAKWLRYDGARWQEDSVLSVFDRAREVCRDVSAEIPAEEKGTIKYLRSAHTRAAIENMARSDPKHAATVDQWDRDLWILNAPGGTSELRTGEPRGHKTHDYLTKSTAVGPGTGAAPRWSEFLAKVTAGDAELQCYLQRVAGYCLTGITAEHVLFFLYGTGANGKSTFISALLGIWGDYAQVAQMETFTENKTDRHPTELAALRGARLVVASETEAGKRWAESRIKALTGGEPIRAHFMRCDDFEFTPQFKLMLSGNHKPALRSVDVAIRRRVQLIPFTVTIPTDERDLKLSEKLRTEWPQILQWAIEGCLAWQQEGLNPPSVVRDATAEYFRAEDAILSWMDERAIISPQAGTTRTSVLYEDFKMWAERTGEHCGSQKRFSQELQDRGFKIRESHGKVVDGIALREN
jgi:putative DNA primase/helicase